MSIALASPSRNGGGEKLIGHRSGTMQRLRSLRETLGRFAPGEVDLTLVGLETSGWAHRRVYRGEVFWEYSGGTFGDGGKGYRA